MTQWTIHATAAFGLEAVVKRQCEALGLGPCRIEEGHVLFPGDVEDVMRANLYLASADRVLIEVGRFPAECFDALFEGTKALDWTMYLPRNARFPVRAKTVQSTLASPSDVQKIVKKRWLALYNDATHWSIFRKMAHCFLLMCSFAITNALYVWIPPAKDCLRGDIGWKKVERH